MVHSPSHWRILHDSSQYLLSLPFAILQSVLGESRHSRTTLVPTNPHGRPTMPPNWSRAWGNRCMKVYWSMLERVTRSLPRDSSFQRYTAFQLIHNFRAWNWIIQDFKHACEAAGQSVTLRYQEGYDHGYYFISSFIKEHISYHHKALTSTK